jgi:prefoldin subunit 5
MEELERKRNELKEFQDEVSALSLSLSSKDSTIKDLRASKKIVSQELEAAC